MAQTLPITSPGPVKIPWDSDETVPSLPHRLHLHDFRAWGPRGVPFQPAGRVGVGRARDTPPGRHPRGRPRAVLRRHPAVRHRVRRTRLPAAPGRTNVEVDEPRAPVGAIQHDDGRRRRQRAELRHAGRRGRALREQLQGKLRRKGQRRKPTPRHSTTDCGGVILVFFACYTYS